ncbi:MAG: hypothetical protein ACREJB_10705 [Planctomycetaceae bacterium]
MNHVNCNLKPSNEGDLQRLIEPLAGYICAANRPGVVLKLALAALVGEVEQTNRAANARVAAFHASRLKVSA